MTDSTAIDELIRSKVQTFRDENTTVNALASKTNINAMVQLAVAHDLVGVECRSKIESLIDDFECWVILAPGAFAPFAEYAAALLHELDLPPTHQSSTVLLVVARSDQLKELADSKRFDASFEKLRQRLLSTGGAA